MSDESKLEETTEDRSYRHAVEGRLQYATVEALEQLTKIVVETEKRVAEMHGWFMGVPDKNGSLEGGVLRWYTIFRGAVRWLIGLAAAGTSAVVLQTLHIYFPKVFGVFK